MKKRVFTVIWLFIMVSALFSACKEADTSHAATTNTQLGDTADPSQTAATTTAPVSAPTVPQPSESQAETTPTAPIDGALLNTDEMRKEHLQAIEAQESALKELLDEHGETMERVCGQLLQLQETAITDGHSEYRWKAPLYRSEEGLLWNYDADQERQQLLHEIEEELRRLSVSGAFSEAYPDMDQRILQGDIVQFKQELVDSLGSHFCYVSLNYCAQEKPPANAYFTINWIDDHWFFYTEWHE